MEREPLADRRRALENAFFARRDRELIAQMHDERELLEATQVKNQELLRHLLDLGITAETLAAMAMVPLLTVAWSDGKLDKAERARILSTARQVEIEAGSAADRMLEHWLEEPPGPQLLAAWKAYIGAVSESLPSDVRHALRNEVLRLSQAVAEASGGFFGIGDRISDAERAALERVESAFNSHEDRVG